MKALLVETEKIEKNIKTIRKAAGDRQIIAALKADGYGFGLIPLAQLLAERCGINFFAVTDPRDALKLRENGFTEQQILVMRSTALHEEIGMILDAQAIAAVGSHDAAVAINGLAKQRGITARVHIKIDTGMGRYGFLPEQIDKILSIYRFMENLQPCGIYTHFNQAFKSKSKTIKQRDAFADVLKKIKDAGFEYGMAHAENSAAALRLNLGCFDAVRIGSAISGRLAGKGGTRGLCRTGVLCADIHELRWLKKGDSIGYGAAYRARRPIKTAVVDAGYCDGVLTERVRDVYRLRDCIRYCLSDLKRLVSGGRFYVTLNGKKARILGHVGMVHTVIDVSDIKCEVGDTVFFDVAPAMINASVQRKYI